MLNELLILAKAMDDANIDCQLWDDKYHVLPKANCYKITLAEDHIKNISFVPLETKTGIRKYGDNLSSFPAFNMRPLYFVENKELGKRLADARTSPEQFDKSEFHQTFCIRSNWDDKYYAKFKRCLFAKASELQSAVKGLDAQVDYLLDTLITRIQRIFPDDLNSIHQILDKAICECINPEKDFAVSLDFLVSTKEKDKGAFTVLFDLDEVSDAVGFTISSAECTNRINHCLLMKSNTDEEQGVDAYGTAGVLCKDVMPKIKAGGLVNCSLRTFNKDVPNFVRYGFSGSSSFPLTIENKERAKKSLEWLGDPDNALKTWTNLGSGETLFIFPSRLNVFDMEKVMNMFYNANSNEDFLTLSSHFAKTLRGIPLAEQPSHFTTFILQKVSNGQHRVLYSRNLTPETIVKSSEKWIESFHNVPVNLNIVNEDGEVTLIKPFELANLLNRTWVKDFKSGDYKSIGNKYKFANNYLGLDIMLDKCPRNLLRYYLYQLLTNITRPGIANRIAYLQGKSGAIGHYDIYNFRRSIQLLGVFLYYNNVSKEEYMLSYPFLLGQLLRETDELHALYCKLERGESYPPTFLGSNYYTIAEENPANALSQLSSRLSYYLGWAKRYYYTNKDTDNPEKKPGLVIYHYKVLSNLAYQLQGVISNEKRFDDFEKTQLLLGFLSPVQKRKSDDNSSTDNDNDSAVDESENLSLTN